MIADDIRRAGTEHTIYFLLTAYIEKLRCNDKLLDIPESITHLPVRGIADLSTRFDKLIAELDAASKQLNDKACAGLKEALHVFGAALSRLRSLERAGNPGPGRRDGALVGARFPDQTGAGIAARGVDNA
jgi:hypothetical protein